MWYKVNKRLIGTQKIRPVRLPSAYQEVEYIQSSWTQYINTGVLMNPNYNVEVRYALLNYGNYNSIFGTRNWAYERYWARWLLSDNGIQLCKDASTTAQYASMTGWDNTDVHIMRFWKEVYLDWVLKHTFTVNTSYTGTFTYPLYIWALNQPWTVWDVSSLKLFYFKIWNTWWIIIRDFVPCYRKSDSVIWLYDLVNKQFYTNAWSWTFTKWPDVN